MRPFLVLLSATFISSLAIASECQLPSSGPVKDVFFREAKNCSLAQELSQNLLGLSTQLRSGPEVSIVMNNRGMNASFDNGHLLWIPQVLFAADKLGKIHESTVSELSTVVMHEYGHAIFNEVLKANFDEEFGGIFDELNSISQEAEENIINKISSRGVRTRGSTVANSPEFMTFFLNIPSYSELYADTLAVLYMNDPAAMYKAMRFASAPGEKQVLVEMRDFSRKHSIEGIQKANDAHTELSLVRTYLGERIEEMDQKAKIEFLGRFENALVRVIKENMKAEKLPSAADKNQRLIELLKLDAPI